MTGLSHGGEVNKPMPYVKRGSGAARARNLELAKKSSQLPLQDQASFAFILHNSTSVALQVT